MSGFRLDRVLDFLTSTELVVGLLWAGVAVFAVALVILMQTRWGQSRPLRKCVVLSLLAHVLLAGYATTVQIMASTPLPDEPVLQVTFVEGPAREAVGAEDPVSREKPWEQFQLDTVPLPELVDPVREQPDQPPEPQRRVRAEPVHLPGDPSLDHLAMAEAEQPEPQPQPPAGPAGRSSPGEAPEAIEAPVPQRRDSTPLPIPDQTACERPVPPAESQPPPVRPPSTGVPTALLQQFAPLPRLAAEVTTPEPASSLAALTDRIAPTARLEPAHVPTRDMDQAYAGPSSRRPWSPPLDWQGPDHANGEENPGLPPAETTVIAIPHAPREPSGNGERQLPNIYKLRVAPDRSRLAERQGATPATEAAVRAALKWLAENQGPDGKWDAGDHGGGRELLVAGRDRQGAGIQADTGMTGLALLAFLASGHTHREGLYRENVRRGLQYLLTVQAADGNLGGGATAYAKMYCHAMAAFALSEAYGMTGDERLRPAVRSAINYTIAAQEPISGGWRYKPGDPGDTSQCGWQLMALKSADLAGIRMQVRTYNGMIRYLRSVSSGQHGGLSAYRPGERISRPMTAEALVCWQFLGMPREHPAGNEAGDYLLEELPGEGQANLYYWYYATLAMYQLQGIHWQRWNESLRTTLVQSQRKTGPMVGSWDPDTVWGGYGGRVYSTAVAALCLEVYYRFLPLYVNAAPADGRTE